MKSMVARALCLAIVLVTTPLFGTQSLPEEKFSQPTPFALPNHDVNRFESPDGRRAMEVITGETALGVLQNLKARHRTQFEKSAARFRSMGYKMTSEVVVVRKIDLEARKRNANGVEPASDSYSDSDGEIIFWSWDDGNDATWEGTVYVSNYGNGGYTYIDGQIDTGHQELEPVWEDTTYYYGGGGSGCIDCPEEPIYMTRARDQKPVQLASLMSDLRYAVHNELEPVHYSLVDWRGHLRSWGRCFVTNCPGVIGGCVATGPAWAKCSLLGCGGVAIGCGIAQMF